MRRRDGRQILPDREPCKSVVGFRLHQEFDVPINATSLRLGVEDELNRKLGTMEISLPVPPAPDEPTTAKARALLEIEPD